MELNKEIAVIAKKFNMNVDDVITFLLSLHFKLSPPAYLNNPDFMKGIQSLGIIEPSATGPKWNVPLFTGQQTAFDWVITEYCMLFERIGKNKYHRESVTRMKKLFTDNPDIRKEEVIEATKMYIDDTNPTYIKFPHYFIEKGVGSAKEQTILSWIDSYRASRQQAQGRNSYNTLQ